MQGKQMNTQY